MALQITEADGRGRQEVLSALCDNIRTLLQTSKQEEKFNKLGLKQFYTYAWEAISARCDDSLDERNRTLKYKDRKEALTMKFWVLKAAAAKHPDLQYQLGAVLKVVKWGMDRKDGPKDFSAITDWESSEAQDMAKEMATAYKAGEEKRPRRDFARPSKKS